MTRTANDLDLIWGASAIATELGMERRNTYYLLERGLLPAKKIGDRWVASRAGLRQHFADVLPEGVGGE